MTTDENLFRNLLAGLPANDQAEVLNSIRVAHGEQLEQTRNPPRRRRRNAAGVLEMPPEL